MRSFSNLVICVLIGIVLGIKNAGASAILPFILVDLYDSSNDCSTTRTSRTSVPSGTCGVLPRTLAFQESSFNYFKGICNSGGIYVSIHTASDCTVDGVTQFFPWSSNGNCFPASTASVRLTCTNETPSPTSVAPSTAPSISPSIAPSFAPVTDAPSSAPATTAPSSSPVVGATPSPSSSPTIRTLAPSRSPIIAASVGCLPFYTTDINRCRSKITLCGGTLKWTGKGCKTGRGVRLGDGGCQCLGYCGYRCKNACNSDPKRECKWDAKQKVCRVKVSGEAGIPIESCVAR